MRSWLTNSAFFLNGKCAWVNNYTLNQKHTHTIGLAIAPYFYNVKAAIFFDFIRGASRPSKTTIAMLVETLYFLLFTILLIAIIRYGFYQFSILISYHSLSVQFDNHFAPLRYMQYCQSLSALIPQHDTINIEKLRRYTGIIKR